MKIGNFSENNDISIDAIRHYMDLGLIVPEKKGGQYHFDDRCQQDLKTILDYKGMGFSLQEIKTIFLYKNFGNLTDYEKNAYYQSLFLDKRSQLEREIQSLTDCKEKLDVRMKRLFAQPESSDAVIGVDLEAISFLQCVKCEGTLILENGVINRNQIVDAVLSCNCGEMYHIENGILIAGEPFRMAGSPALDEYIADYITVTDPIYLENIYKGLHWMKRKLDHAMRPNTVILELGTGVGFLLRNIWQALPDDALYIAVDRNLERQRYLKELLERNGVKKRVLFVCADFLNIPLRSGEVDILLDHAGTSNYSFEHETFLLKEVEALIKPGASLISSFICFKNFSSDGLFEAKFRHNFQESEIKRKLSDYSQIEEKTSEYVHHGGRYENFFVKGEQVYSYQFYGKRRG